MHVRTQYTKAEERPFTCDVYGTGLKTIGSLSLSILIPSHRNSSQKGEYCEYDNFIFWPGGSNKKGRHDCSVEDLGMDIGGIETFRPQGKFHLILKLPCK